jgi:hypothetical protein
MFWAINSPDIFSAAPSHCMLTTCSPPFKHRFHPVNDLIAAFVLRTQSCFGSEWINCLDESMSVWTNM